MGKTADMRWTVETHAAADDEILALPPKLQARLLRLMEMVENVGLDQILAKGRPVPGTDRLFVRHG